MSVIRSGDSAITSLRNSGKRVRVHDTQVVIKLPKAAKDQVDDIAARREVSASTVYREALAEYFERRGFRI